MIGFIPEAVLASQYFQNPNLETPERRLLFAVLDEAFNCLALKVTGVFSASASSAERRRQTVQEEAADWFASNDTYPFTFIYCCEHLDLNPVAIRQAIAKGEQRLYQSRHGGCGPRPVANSYRKHRAA